MARPSLAKMIARFWSHVEKGDGCWPWTGSLTAGGYGRVRFDSSKKTTAHRVAYSLCIGPIPDGMMVCHRCDNRRCVNPVHLFLGTAADNMADAVAKRRIADGTRNARAKLQPDQVISIRRRRGAGERSSALAREFGVTPKQIGRIARGTSWRRVMEGVPSAEAEEAEDTGGVPRPIEACA